MPFQSPVNQLRPIQPTPSPLDRFENIARIQSLIEGRDIQRQELDLRRQTMQTQQDALQKKAAAFQRASQIIAASGGDMQKALRDMMADPDLPFWAPDYLKNIQGLIPQEDTDIVNFETTDEQGNAVTRFLKKSEAAKIGTFPKPKTGDKATSDIQNYQFYADQEVQAGRQPKSFEEWRKAPASTANPTASIQEYNFYAEQEQAAGRTPKSFDEWRAKPTTSGSPTSEIQQYQFYAEQETAAGRTPISFDAWQTRDANRRRVTPPTVTIQTVNAAGEPVTKIVPKTPGSEFAAQPTAEMQNRDAALKKIDPIIKSIDELSAKINTQSGVVARISGAVEKAKAQANLNDDIAEYNAVIEGFTPMLARAVGHTGVLTQQDVDSVKAAFPNPGDSKSVRDRKMARFKSILNSGKQGQLGEVLSGAGGAGGAKKDPLGIR